MCYGLDTYLGQDHTVESILDFENLLFFGSKFKVFIFSEITIFDI